MKTKKKYHFNLKLFNMNKRKLISFLESKGIISDDINKQIDNTPFNLTDIILQMTAKKLNVNYSLLFKEYNEWLLI